jgi:hypothetical protein
MRCDRGHTLSLYFALTGPAPYSSTSSARVISRAGGAMPSAFAVYRLIAR